MPGKCGIIYIQASIGFLRGDGMIERIAVDTKIHFGKPCVVGTRITVQSVLELLDGGLSFDEIIRDYYPDLTTQDIQACVQYAIALVAAEDIHLKVAPI
jgi:uncharacterized protein (DUF433 family)